MGWIVFGIVMLFFSILIGIFPRKIQKDKPTEEHELDSEKCNKVKESAEPKENGDLKGRNQLND